MFSRFFLSTILLLSSLCVFAETAGHDDTSSGRISRPAVIESSFAGTLSWKREGNVENLVLIRNLEGGNTRDYYVSSRHQQVAAQLQELAGSPVSLKGSLSADGNQIVVTEVSRAVSTGRILGTVGELTGDRFPGPRPLGAIQSHPFAGVRVYAYPGTLSVVTTADGFVRPGEINTLGKVPSAVTTTNSQGKYELSLPPGNYTVVAEIRGTLVHAEGASPSNLRSSTWSTITVDRSSVTNQDIIQNHITD